MIATIRVDEADFPIVKINTKAAEAHGVKDDVVQKDFLLVWYE